jgi:hypothetical protein
LGDPHLDTDLAGVLADLAVGVLEGVRAVDVGSRSPSRLRLGPWMTEILSVPVGVICIVISEGF